MNFRKIRELPERRNGRKGDGNRILSRKLIRIAEINVKITPCRQVLKGLEIEREATRTQLKFSQAIFVEYEPHGKIWMGGQRTVPVTQ